MYIVVGNILCLFFLRWKQVSLDKNWFDWGPNFLILAQCSLNEMEQLAFLYSTLNHPMIVTGFLFFNMI